MYDYFSPILSTGAMYFEIILSIFLIGIFIYGLKNYRFFIWKFFALAFGIFAFESLTAALWIISDLGSYSYIHDDNSWVMTLTWASLIMCTKFIFDKFSSKIPCIFNNTKVSKMKNYSLLKEFVFVTIFSSIFGLLLVVFLKSIGVFSYSPEMQEIVNSGITILGRPLEAIIYFPVFIFTVFSFYKYWELAMYDKNLFNNYKINFGKDIMISVIIIVLIGYLIHPILLVNNIFIYILLLVGFIINLLLTGFIISKFEDIPLFVRFISGSFIFTSIGSVILSLFVGAGVLQFSQSILNSHTDKTIMMPYLNITDVEFSGILLFSYLMIAIVKYFKIITDNKEIKLNNKNMTFKGYKSLFTNIK